MVKGNQHQGGGAWFQLPNQLCPKPQIDSKIIFKMVNIDLWVTLNDLQGQIHKQLIQGGLSFVDLTYLVKKSAN